MQNSSDEEWERWWHFATLKKGKAWWHTTSKKEVFGEARNYASYKTGKKARILVERT